MSADLDSSNQPERVLELQLKAVRCFLVLVSGSRVVMVMVVEV